MFLEQRGEAFEQNSLLKHMFCMGKSENFGDLLTTMTAMEGFEPVPENGAYPEDSMQEGFSKWLVYKEWKDSFAISQAMVEDARLMDMKKKPAAFMTAYGRTRERFGAALYGGAIQGVKSVKFGSMNFDTTSADGLSVFNTAHPPKVKGNKQCNMFSDAFSVDALNKMETDMQNFRGDNDEILDVAPDTIMIPNIATLKKEVFAAIEAASEEFAEGAVGAGRGTICYGMKGGIGSSSRQMKIDGETFTVGVLVQSNYGASADFRRATLPPDLAECDKGSIIMIVATDLPLSARQLKRVLRRCSVGMARLGSYIGHGSGEIAVGFTTAPRERRGHFDYGRILSEDDMNIPFRAVGEATEEAILKSMLFSNADVELSGKEIPALRDYLTK